MTGAHNSIAEERPPDPGSAGRRVVDVEGKLIRAAGHGLADIIGEFALIVHVGRLGLSRRGERGGEQECVQKVFHSGSVE
jgi:hypothetical protein